MTTYNAISDSRIDADSIIDQSLMTDLRNNPIAITEGASGAPKIAGAALASGAALYNLAASSIGLGKLKIGSGAISTSAAGTATVGTLPGGAYGFYPQISQSGGSNGANVSINWFGTNPGTSYISRINFNAPDGGTTYARQYYLQASPPYDIGDGPVPLFVFVLLDAGKPMLVYTCQDPPWAYNGPTDITPTREDSAGRQFKTRFYMDANGDPATDEIQITSAFKNSDMGLIPHPFLGNDLAGKNIILLNSVETADLLALQRAGEDIHKLIYDGYLTFSATPSSAKAPPGCIANAVKWKNNQAKWKGGKP